MSDNLIIVFTKNFTPGKVKTRLAREIGDELAMEVFKDLVKHTRTICSTQEVADVRVYFTDQFDEEMWPEDADFYLQEGKDLGERMKKAFEEGFKDGYTAIVGIGTDLDEINERHLEEAFEELEYHDCVLGESEDGGYYLVGMSEMIPSLFLDKPWSTADLLDETTAELELDGYTYVLLEALNDIDTIVDFKRSKLYANYQHHFE